MIAVGNIQKRLKFRLNTEQEDRFRKTNFGADMLQARIFVILVLLPFVALLVNDYGFFGLSRTFYGLLALRIAFAAYTIQFLKNLKGFTNYRSYDRAAFFWGIFLALANTAINATRPENFVAHTIVTVLAVFILVLAIPNRFTNQLILALVYTFGQTLVIVPNLWISPQASFTVLLSTFMANTIAIASSWLLHFWRRREFMVHEEIQKAKVEAEKKRASLQAIINSLPMGLWIADETGKMVFINDTTSKIWGGKAPSAKYIDEYYTYKAWWTETGERIAAEDMPLARAVKGETLTENVIDFERFDGTRGTQLVSSAPIKMSDGTIVGGVAIVQDITEHKEAEEKIQRLADIVESSNDSILTLSLEGIIISWNKGAEQVYGYSAEELLGKNFSILEPAPLKGEINKLIERVKNNEKLRNYETLRLKKDGTLINVSVSFSPVFSSSGKLVATSTIARDITERKQEERKIHRYNSVLEGINQIFGSVVKAETQEKLGNVCLSVALKVTGSQIGFVGEVGIDRLLHDIAISDMGWEQCTMYDKTGHRRPPGDFILHGLYGCVIDTEKSFFTNDPQSHPNSIGLPQGHPELTSFLGVPLILDGKMVGMLAVANREGGYSHEQQEDLEAIAQAVTQALQRKKAEEVLAKIDIARQKEIHHRIKNNLQVISSLLDLAAEKFNNRDCIKDSEVLEAFRESQDRVASMALIHEELYKGGGFETLNFSPYIKELAENLFQTYQLMDTDISLNMDLEENTFFNMDIAVPLGIIINELISNSLKHAFIGKDKGEIGIKLYREENSDCINGVDNNKEDCKNTDFVLAVSDNGVGIPENLDIEDLESLGLQLVVSLVDQLDGELELNRENGTEFIIKFTVTE